MEEPSFKAGDWVKVRGREAERKESTDGRSTDIQVVGTAIPFFVLRKATLADARYMLVTCSAFVSYVIDKAASAGVDLGS